MVPKCRIGIQTVLACARHWFKTFVLAVYLDSQVAVDDSKLSRKYFLIYNNIRVLDFESLFRLGDAVNVNLVKELYVNWKPMAILDAVY